MERAGQKQRRGKKSRAFFSQRYFRELVRFERDQLIVGKCPFFWNRGTLSGSQGSALQKFEVS